MTDPIEQASPIEDYAMIGDCTTAALVGRNGSIDWLCWPRFDSAACFAALLGTSDHGRWLIGAAEGVEAQSRRAYRDGSLVLDTTITAATGEAVVTDFMPIGSRHSAVVRIVTGQRGSVAMRMSLGLRFDYGGVIPWVTRLPDGHGVVAIAGPDMTVLRASIPVHGAGMTTAASFTVKAGERVEFALIYAPSHLHAPRAFDLMAALRETEAYWTRWCERGSYRGPYEAAVRRSLVTLKALTYQTTGGIVAAATTSLPEKLGGSRNWDYRYCWLRDATITLLAFMHGGYYEEARAWRDWLHRSVAGSPDALQIMYGLAGERRLSEWEVDHLPGYAGSKPVRVGNAAAGQLQLDVYGEVLDAMHQARVGGLAFPPASWDVEVGLIKRLLQIWQEPDEGIWETRGGRQHFTFSKVMAWVAVDRAVRSAEQFNLRAPLEEWRAARETMFRSVCERGFSERLNSFVQVFGQEHLDASLLLIPMVGFLPPDDPRVIGTVAAIERGLLQDGFVQRYNTSDSKDGLPPGEGVFLACSFWLANCYAMQGRREDARALFERLLGLCNDVGLLAEEYDPVARRQVGNVPQAFSHVALITTAMVLGGDGPIAARAADGGGGEKA